MEGKVKKGTGGGCVEKGLDTDMDGSNGNWDAREEGRNQKLKRSKM